MFQVAGQTDSDDPPMPRCLIAASPFTPCSPTTRMDTARRLSVYRSETAPLIEFYETKGQSRT